MFKYLGKSSRITKEFMPNNSCCPACGSHVSFAIFKIQKYFHVLSIGIKDEVYRHAAVCPKCFVSFDAKIEICEKSNLKNYRILVKKTPKLNICEKCGKAILFDYNFCPNCGENID